MNRKMTILIGGLLVLAGCSDHPSKPSTPDKSSGVSPKPEKSTFQTVIGGLTGQTAIEKGKETRAKIEEISKKENADLDEVMP